MNSPLLSIIVFLPLAGAVVVGFIPGRHLNAIRWTSAGFALAAFLVSLVLYGLFDRTVNIPQFQEKTLWIDVPSLGIKVSYFLGVDGLSLPLVVLTTLLTFLSILASWNIQPRPKLFYIVLLVLEVGILGVFTSLDLLLFFLFWEVELIPMYLIIGIWGGPRREYAAMKFVLYTLLGSALMLVGILALYFYPDFYQPGLPRTFDMLELAKREYVLGFQMVFFLFLFFAFAVKLPVFPFHTWLPDAHVEAPTAGSVILAGVLLKMGGYGMFRILAYIFPDALERYVPLLATLAVINIIYGAVVSMVQRDLKKMVAFSSISHMGFVLLGLAARTDIGMTGAVLMMFAHGVITGLLFLLVGSLYERTHTRDIPTMGGLAPKMPWLAVLWSMAGLASLGLPGMAGFVAEFLVFIGSYRTLPVYSAIAAVGIVITAGYTLWMLKRVFFGPFKEEFHHISDAKGLELVPLTTLVAIILLVGLYPAVITDYISPSVLSLLVRFAS